MAAVLDFSQQRLETVPSLSKDVERLDLSRNFLRSFPADFASTCTRLTHLFLGCNELTAIPPLSTLEFVEELHLNNNRITKINDGLRSLVRLRVLNLRANRIATLENLDENAHLEWLSLSGNCLSQIDMKCLAASGPRLRFLGLYCNKLGDTAAILGVLSTCVQLEELTAGCNPFSRGRPLRARGETEQFWRQIREARPSVAWIDMERV